VNDCILGDNAFASLLDRLEDSPSLTLKCCMSQRDDIVYSVGSPFTTSSLSSANQSTPVLIYGQKIYNLATNALKNGKKALSIEQSAYKDGKLPSSWNDDDLDNFILDGMWKMPMGATVYDADQENQQNMEDGAAEELATAADTFD
jgi:hypothetical protein